MENAKTTGMDLTNAIGLVKRELVRVIDFANSSSNPVESNKLIEEIYDAFDIDIIKGDVDIYE